MVTFSALGKLGRIGNQLWQIAAVIGYARKYSQDYVLPIWPYTQHFKYGFNQSSILKPFAPLHEKGFHFTPIPKYKNVDLYGYFQSIKYWDNIQRDIRALFSPNDAIQTLLDKTPMEPNTCAIHVRRTDYLQLNDYHPSLPMDYYQRAMKSMKSDRYIIFSDDIEWCKTEPTFSGATFVNSGNDLLDFFMMRQCDRFIIANSSYSWWSSFLSTGLNKRIIAPKKEQWFGTKYNENNVDDLYLTNWEIV